MDLGLSLVYTLGTHQYAGGQDYSQTGGQLDGGLGPWPTADSSSLPA